MELSTKASVLKMYTDALTMLNKTSWPGVEERLNGPDGEQVVEALMDYASATMAADVMRDEYSRVTRITHPKAKERDHEQYRLNTLRIKYEHESRDKLVALRVLLVGQAVYDEETAEYEERMEAFHAECEAIFDEENEA